MYLEYIWVDVYFFCEGKRLGVVYFILRVFKVRVLVESLRWEVYIVLLCFKELVFRVLYWDFGVRLEDSFVLGEGGMSMSIVGRKYKDESRKNENI